MSTPPGPPPGPSDPDRTPPFGTPAAGQGPTSPYAAAPPGRPAVSGAAPPPPPRRRGLNLAPSFVVTTAFVLVVLGAVVGILVLFLSGRAVAAEVTPEAIGTAGANPFMPAVGRDQAGVTPPPGSGGSFPGGTPGLYGGTRDNSSCDAAAMVAFLRDNPDKAAAWARVQGITAAEIPAYVAELTPVVLRSDTWVTNHGFRDGRETSFTAVLQAGTAVLVDRFGVPRAKCFCGNPLTPAVVPADPRFVGDVWPGFSRTSITVIEQNTTIITNYTLVDPVTEEVFERTFGTAGESDRPGSGTTTAGPTTSAAPPTTAPQATTAAPRTRTVRGQHVLTQADGGDCAFSAAPRITGTIELTVAPDGTVRGTMAARGSGRRGVTCGEDGATLNWSQEYSASFSGTVRGGRLTASGTLDSVDRSTYEGCTFAGTPAECPTYRQGSYSYTLDLTGSVDPATGAGSGDFTVNGVNLPTGGTWSVG